MRLIHLYLTVSYGEHRKLNGSATFGDGTGTSVSVPIDQTASDEILAALDRAKDRTVKRVITSLQDDQRLLIDHAD